MTDVPSLTTGLLAGAAWNLASLWCLSRLMTAWLGSPHSTRRALGWLAVKLALYGLILLVFIKQIVSPTGFGLGFGLTLVAAMAWCILTARHTLWVPHGR